VTEVCENIGPAQRRLRVKIGVASLAVAVALEALLLLSGVSRGWRVLTLPPLWIGVLALIEASMRTCILLAARGIRNMDDGNQAIADDDVRLALQQRARRVHLLAAATALLLTALLITL
jgi:hypothetical protein